MNSHIEKVLGEVTKLDSWDIMSILGGVNYAVQQAAINQVVKLIPEPPEKGSGLENFTRWEQHMRDPQIRKVVNPFVGLSNRVKDVLNEYTDTPPSEYQNVLEFMLQRPPVRATFEAEYNRRKQLGMRPSMPLSVFVDMEYAAAMQRHANLTAKGEAAVLLLQQLDGTDEEVPEWMIDTIDQKVEQKLEQRWNRAELRRTNPKLSKDKRDEAEANQQLIAAVITELGGTPPSYADEMKASDEVDEYIERLSSKVPK
jgi:hypothetical protein